MEKSQDKFCTVPEAALRESEERFRLTFQTSPDAINLNRLDDGMYIDINEGFTRIMGYTKDDIIGKSSLSIPIWKNSEDRGALVRGLQENGYVENLEAEFVAKDGTLKNGLMSARVLSLQGEDVIITITRDITELKAKDEAFRKTSELFQKVFDNQLDGLFILNADNPPRVLKCNKAAAAILGYSIDELIGQTLRTLNINQESVNEFIDSWSAAMAAEGRLDNYEYPMMRKDGSVFPAQHSAFELTDDAGQRTGWVTIMRDLTQQKQMEKRIRQAQKMESIGNLAGGIAHDFNNLLFPIVGMAELLLEDLPAGSPEHENIREILHAGRRGSELVKQILAFSRQTEHRMIPVRVQQVLGEVLKLIHSTIPANIEIQQNISKDCGMVNADPTQIHQVAMNLITNAFHAVEDINGVISVELAERAIGKEDDAGNDLPAGRYAVLTVSDNGCGMDEAVMDKIFEPYFTTKKHGKGTGLGLAVAHGIVKEHQGHIQLCSNSGKGTTLHVYLPLIRKSSQSPSHDRGITLETGDERILLVDDEASIVRLEKQMLERLGYHVTACTGSIEALKAFTSDPQSFNLVISDINMPNMTGDQLAKELIAVRPDIPIIICTGFSERMDREKASKSGINDFLMKPIVKTELSNVVRKVLDGRSGKA